MQTLSSIFFYADSLKIFFVWAHSGYIYENSPKKIFMRAHPRKYLCRLTQKNIYEGSLKIYFLCGPIQDIFLCGPI